MPDRRTERREALRRIRIPRAGIPGAEQLAERLSIQVNVVEECLTARIEAVLEPTEAEGLVQELLGWGGLLDCDLYDVAGTTLKLRDGPIWLLGLEKREAARIARLGKYLLDLEGALLCLELGRLDSAFAVLILYLVSPAVFCDFEDLAIATLELRVRNAMRANRPRQPDGIRLAMLKWLIDRPERVDRASTANFRELVSGDPPLDTDVEWKGTNFEVRALTKNSVPFIQQKVITQGKTGPRAGAERRIRKDQALVHLREIQKHIKKLQEI